MRYILLLIAVAGALTAGLAAWVSTRGERPLPVLVALTAPTSTLRGEALTMFGGLVVPPGKFEVGTYSCQAGSCRRSLWRPVSGPGESWSSMGVVRFDELGVGTIEVRLFEADAVTDRVLGVWRREVEVVSSADVSFRSAAAVRAAAPVRW